MGLELESFSLIFFRVNLRQLHVRFHVTVSHRVPLTLIARPAAAAKAAGESPTDTAYRTASYLRLAEIRPASLALSRAHGRFVTVLVAARDKARRLTPP